MLVQNHKIGCHISPTVCNYSEHRFRPLHVGWGTIRGISQFREM